MSGAAHTPGPWIAVHCADDGGEFSMHAANGINVALSIGGTKSEAANARLIAAAPELLEALQACMDFLEPMRFDRPSDDARALELDELSRAAIAKATGAQP